MERQTLQQAFVQGRLWDTNAKIHVPVVWHDGHDLIFGPEGGDELSDVTASTTALHEDNLVLDT